MPKVKTDADGTSFFANEGRRRRAFGVAFFSVVALWALPGMSETAGTMIVSWTKSAKPGETVLLTGQNLNQGVPEVTDGAQTLPARVLRQDPQKMLAVTPGSLGAGTLWTWINASGASTTRVAINAPEPWWAQPDRADFGGTVRIFGRNFDGHGGTLPVVLSNNGANRYLDAEIINGNALSLTLFGTDTNGNPLQYGTNLFYIKEPKTSDLYGPITLVLQPPFAFPSYSVNVTNYGANPYGDAPANAGFIAAFNDVAAHGGGTVNVPAGTFLLDETYGYSNAFAVLPTINNRCGAYALQGAGAGQTILKFKPSTAFSLYAFYGILLFDNSAIRDLTIEVAEGSYSRNDRELVRITGTNALVSNVTIDTDSTTNCMSPVVDDGDYSTLQNIQIYCPSPVSFNARQVEINNVTHYGAREMGWYDLSGQDLQNVFPCLFLTTGSTEVCLENCTGFGRWYQNKGHYKRFFVGQLNAGAGKHLYLANNVATNHVSQPWSNSGECVLFEGADGFYCGRATASGTTLSLLGSPITNYAALNYQARAPLAVVIRDGTGLGQIRHGVLNSNGVTLTLDKPFTIPPDATSSVVVAFSFEENIVANNALFSGAVYPEANTGIEIYGESLNNVVVGNRVSGYQSGYSDWVMPDPSTVGCFNNIISNVFVGTGRGIASIVSPGICFAGQEIGNVYRRNVIANMNLGVPVWSPDSRREGLSVQTMMGAAGPTNAIVAPIYEGNTLSVARAAMGIDSNAVWVAMRNNSFLNMVDHGCVTNTSTISESNVVGVLPQLQVTTSTAPVRVGFNSAIAAYGNYVQSSNEVFAWSSNGSGSLSFSVANPAAHTTTSLETTLASGLTLSNSTLLWSNLAPNVYAFDMALTAPQGTNVKQFCLFSGPCDDFEGPLIITNNGLPGVAQSYSFGSVGGLYVTAVQNTFSAGGFPFYHTLSTGRIYNGSSTALKLAAVNQEVALRNATYDGTVGRQNAVLSFVNNMYNQLTTNSTFKVRLLCGPNQYYEFVDHPFYNPFFQTRTLSKVVNGTAELVAERIASHCTESMVIFEKIGPLVRVNGWGDSIELTDPNPLAVTGWEALVATFPGASSFDTTYNSWVSFDNIHFVKTDAPVYSEAVLLAAPTGLHVVVPQ